jgi:hypothetical protein
VVCFNLTNKGKSIREKRKFLTTFFLFYLKRMAWASLPSLFPLFALQGNASIGAKEQTSFVK